MDLEPLIKMGRDIADSSKLLSNQEARYLVDMYYIMQEQRIGAAGRVRSMGRDNGEPVLVLDFIGSQMDLLENQMKRAIGRYVQSTDWGQWAQSICGIGPVLAGGFIANMEAASKFQTVGNLYSFSGLVPGQKRKRGEKLNYNPAMKRLAWLAGESFVKVKGNKNDVYGKLYDEKKAYYHQKNEAGGFAERAAMQIASKKWDKTTVTYKAYEQGKLPDGEMHAMAKRFAAKMFLAHLWEVGMRLEGKNVPKPYAVAHMSHAHVILPPNFPLTERKVSE